jgi:hypothetical protein
VLFSQLKTARVLFSRFKTARFRAIFTVKTAPCCFRAVFEDDHGNSHLKQEYNTTYAQNGCHSYSG